MAWIQNVEISRTKCTPIHFVQSNYNEHKFEKTFPVIFINRELTAVLPASLQKYVNTATNTKTNITALIFVKVWIVEMFPRSVTGCN